MQLEPNLPQSAPAPAPTLYADKDSLRVFRKLFHVQKDQSDTLPGKIRWDSFVKTLAKLGFSAEKLHGSAWQFTPKSIELPEPKRGIQFHEPHPDAEIPFRLARRYGRRLSRAYGWCGETFKAK